MATKNITHPVDTLCAWVDLLSLPEKNELAQSIFDSLPQMPCASNTRVQPGEWLLTWLAQLRSDTPQRIVGCTLAFIAVVNFFVLREKGSAAGWDYLVCVNQAVRKELIAKGHTAQTLAPMDAALQELPLRRARWLKHARVWRELLTTTLSEGTLYEWLDIKKRGLLLV